MENTDPISEIEWQCFDFSALSTQQLYDLLRLRAAIFVVEQRCAYLDLDAYDCQPGTLHLLGTKEDELVAYARLLPKGLTFDTTSIGRVAVAEKMRGKNLGKHLMRQALHLCEQHWPAEPITIHAQHRLLDFYQQQQFVAISEPHFEDDILHINMRRG